MKKVLKNLFRKVQFKFTSYSIDEYRGLGVIIGENCNLLNCNLDLGHAYLIEIGDNCTLTNCTILAHDASLKFYLKKSKVGIVKIGDNSFVGWGSIILPNVKIGNNCIIGAGCVVSKDIPDNSVVVGNPCRIVSSTTDYINKHSDFMKEKPVFDKYWKNKSLDEKISEKKLLIDTFGYDE